MTTHTGLRHLCSACRATNPPAAQHCLRCGAPLGLVTDDRLKGADLTRQIEDWSVFGVSTGFVGRHNELAQLVDSLRRAERERNGGLILLRGPVGSGKSRLIARLHEEIEELGIDALVLTATVHSDDASPWAPIAELLRQRFYIAADASPEGWRTQLNDGARALLGAERGAEVAGLLAALVGVRSESRADAPLDAALAALVDLMRADASRDPLVLVLDDADMGSSEARRLAAALLPAVRSAPILIVCACDTAATHETFGLRADDDAVSTLDLLPLDDETIRTHVRGLLRRCVELPDLLVDTIAEHAFGSPLAAEEIVRICIAEGVIDVAESAWVAFADRIGEVSLPETFDDLVRARLACLDPEQHELLQAAAIVGGVFWPGILLAVKRGQRSGDPSLEAYLAEAEERSALQQRLEALTALDLVQRSPAADLPGEPAWQFKHAVERRLLAERAAEEVAARVHETAADWMLLANEDPTEAQLAFIAEHFEFGGRPDRAAPYFALLAERFRTRWATERARDLYLRALWVVEPADTQLRLRLLHDLSSVLHVLGEFEQSVPILDEMAALAWRTGQQAKVGVAFNKLGRAWRSLGRYDDGARFLNHALGLFESVKDAAGIAMTLDDLGRIDWLRGDYDRANERYQRALSLRRDRGDQRAVATSLHHLGTLLVHRGEFRRALDNFREALDLLRKVSDLRGISETLNAIGVILLERGEVESALKLWHEALASAEQSGDRVLRATVLNNIGELELVAGRLEGSREALTRSIELATAAGDRRILADATRNLAALEGRRGNRVLAVTLGEEALQIARELGSRLLEGTALRTLAELQSQTVFSADGSGFSESDQFWIDAIAIFEELGNAAELARTWYGFGTTRIERGELMQGRKLVEMARDTFERLEMRRVLSEARTLIGSL